MEKKPINPLLQQALELGPTLLFFLIYVRIKDDTFTVLGRDYSGFITATLIFIPILLVAMAVLWRLTGKLSRMQMFTAFMVLFFGGLTAWFNDDRFFKMKTTIVYASLAALLGIGLILGRNGLQWAMGEVLPMAQEGWAKLTQRVTLLFVALAVANEVIWRTQSETVWVALETFAFPALMFVFLSTQFYFLRHHITWDEDKT